MSKDITKRVEQERALLHVATKDKLTDLHNCHRGEQPLAERYGTARTLQRPLTLAMCDIDHFKRINGEFGRPAGDRILAEMADMPRQTVHSRDAVVHWGGEEFMIALSECSQTDAVDLAKHILDYVNAYEDKEIPTLTLSLGLATLAPNEAIDELIARADSAFYETKHTGCNWLSIAT